MEEHFMCNIFFLNVIIFFNQIFGTLLFFKGLIAQNLSQRISLEFFKSLFSTIWHRTDTR